MSTFHNKGGLFVIMSNWKGSNKFLMIVLQSSKFHNYHIIISVANRKGCMSLLLQNPLISAKISTSNRPSFSSQSHTQHTLVSHSLPFSSISLTRVSTAFSIFFSWFSRDMSYIDCVLIFFGDVCASVHVSVCIFWGSGSIDFWRETEEFVAMIYLS